MVDVLTSRNRVESDPSDPAVEGSASVMEAAQGLKVPLPLLFLLLMLLVIMAVFDILKKSYDVHDEANRRVAKAALEITLSRTQSGLNGIASRVAAEAEIFGDALPQIYFPTEIPANQDLVERTLFLSFDESGHVVDARVGRRELLADALEELSKQPVISRLFQDLGEADRHSSPLLVVVEDIPYILSDPQLLDRSTARATGSAAGGATGGATGGSKRRGGASHVAVALPARDLLFDELERYEIFGSGELKEYLERKDDLSSLTELIVSLQKKEYAQFHFSAVAQIIIVLAAFIIAVMIGHHIDRKNDALRQSRDLMLRREKEAQRLRQTAERASEAKSRFIQNMSHELRTPLNAVIGFSEIISNEKLGPLEAKYRDCATDINDAGTHLLGVINDILDLSKIESGMEDVSEDEVDLAELARAVVSLVAKRANSNAVTLETQIDESLPSMRADSLKLRKVLTNLVSNAVKFNKPGGSVTLSVACREGMGIVINVADCGVGMAAEEIPKALAHFGQVNSELNRQHDGSGLGLPIAKSLTEIHGGSFELRSQPGVGTTVTLTFPADRMVWKRDAA